MKTSILNFILLILSFSVSTHAAEMMGESRSSTSSQEIFLGAGEALGFPASIRYRSGDIEGGYMAPGLLGAAKVYKNPYYPSLYSEFGAGLLGGSSAGFFASFGGSWKMFGALRFRSEINMVGGLSTYVKGGALVGLSIVF